MAQTVAGCRPTPLWTRRFYARGRRLPLGAARGLRITNNGSVNNKIISGVAPYWRIAYEQDWGKNSFEFGTLGEYAAASEIPMTPAGMAINGSLQNAPTDRFLDCGARHPVSIHRRRNQISVTSRWIHEKQDLNASFAANFGETIAATISIPST